MIVIKHWSINRISPIFYIIHILYLSKTFLINTQSVITYRFLKFIFQIWNGCMDVIHVNIYLSLFILHILSLCGILNLEQSCGRNHTQNLCFHLHSIPSRKTMWHVSSPSSFDLNQYILSTVVHLSFRLLAFFKYNRNFGSIPCF